MGKRLRLIIPTFFLLLALASSFAYNATGGVITTDGLYTVHTFTSNGSFNVSGGTISATVLVVAGGGQGGSSRGAGGGAGGLIYNTSYSATGNITVVVGAGGSGGTFTASGGNGTNSSFGTLIANGGGGGGGDGKVGYSGGSGGGGGALNAAGGSATPAGQGYAGGKGDTSSTYYSAGGGGGAGAVGQDGTNAYYAGAGGAGLNFSINGTNTNYSCGGGGGALDGTPQKGSGAPGGCSRAGVGKNDTDGTAGEPNSGCGGGGGGNSAGSAKAGGNGGSGIVIVRYLTYVAPLAVDNIVWLNQTPANLTTTNIIATRLRIQYNITNITSGTPYLLYKTNNSLSDISLFINGTGYGGYKNKTGTNVSSIFNFTLDDNEVLPGTYTLNYSLFYNTAHSATALSSNDYISTELFNVSNKTPYNFYEFMANGTGVNNIVSYYCNSSYAFNQAPGANANCALIGNVPNNQSYDHTHNANTSHHYLPFSINTTSGTFGSTAVRITPQSFLLIRGAPTAGTNVYTIANTARASTTKLSTNSGNTFTNLTYSVDTHIHQFTADETIYYQAYATVAGAANNSSLFSQVFGLTNLPPTTPAVLTPTAGNNYGNINISWLASQNLTPSTIYYNVSLLNTDLTFNKTLIGNTTNLSYLWNSINTTQGNYTIRVMAMDNNSLNSSGYSEEFTVATFVITPIIPTDGVVLEGNNTVISYSVDNVIIGATCGIVMDTIVINSTIVNNATVSYLASVSAGTHSWYVVCTSLDVLYTTSSATRTFSMNFNSYAYATNLTTAPANVYNQPQALFYDKNGTLNVLYYTDEPAGTTLWIKTISQNTTIATYNKTYAKTNSFYSVFRDANGTLILTFNSTGGTPVLLKPETNGSITAIATTGFPSGVVMNNTAYDAYTYANTAHYENLSLTANSFFFLMVPTTTGTFYIKKQNNNTTLTQVGTKLTSSAVWQTMANNSALTEWYYLNTTGTNIQLEYYNGTNISVIKVLDVGYNDTQLNNSIGNFYEYGGKKYVMLSNLTNTTIYDINNNLTYQLNTTLSNPSFIFFVDNDTFLFYNTVGSTTTAYSCYFKTVANCTIFSATQYGFSMPYERGTMTTAKRSGSSDVVAKGIISSGEVVKLLYNQNTYDGKYVCYDEMAETRKPFIVGVYTNTSANVLSNNSYGYVIPSSILGIGNKKAYFTCANGTQRLFLAGLNSNYTINAYSLEIPKGVYYTFQALDQYSIPIAGAIMTAYRFSVANQQFVPIEQGITDFNGNAIFYLEPYQFYKFIVNADGFVVLTFDLTPGADTLLEFKLQTTGGTILVIPTFDRVFNDVSYSLLPISNFQNQSFNITYTISSANATLEYYGMNITREYNGTTTMVYNTTGTSAGGSVLQYTATQNGTYRVNTWFKAQNYTLYRTPQVSYFLSAKQGLSYVKDRLPGMMGGWAYFLIATCVALLVAGYISRYTIDGAGIMGLMVLWFFTVMNPGAVIIGSASCTLGTIGCITIVMATALTSIIVVGGLVWKQFG